MRGLFFTCSQQTECREKTNGSRRGTSNTFTAQPSWPDTCTEPRHTSLDTRYAARPAPSTVAPVVPVFSSRAGVLYERQDTRFREHQDHGTTEPKGQNRPWRDAAVGRRGRRQQGEQAGVPQGGRPAQGFGEQQPSCRCAMNLVLWERPRPREAGRPTADCSTHASASLEHQLFQLNQSTYSTVL